MSAAEVLVDHALGLRWAEVPDIARRAAATFLHDTLCVGAAGAKAAHADDILAAASAWGAGTDGRILGRPGVRLPAVQAAFVNAFQIHGQEFDCVHEPAVLHPMATLTAAILAEHDRSGPYSGEDILAAIVAGCDVSVTLGVAATTPLKFFRPATSGLFGALAATARLRGLSRETTLDAFGYGLAFTSGTMQAHAEGKPALPVQIANAARAALMACDVAATGLPGPRASIDGPFGYMTLFETGFDLAPALADLGRRYRIAEVSWKPFPTGRAGHGGIVAIQSLMSQGLTPDNLDRLVWRAPPLIHRLVGRPITAPLTPAYARLCLAYLAAVTLTRGTVGLADFDPRSLSDPTLHALAARVEVLADDNPDPAAFTPAEAIATLRDGRTLTARVTTQLGAPEQPLTPQQHLDKARACLAFAGLETVHDPLTALMASFHTLDDASQAFRLVAGDPA
ncbi:MmgE/PrpD family protein [Phenylobacterium sp.]|jgi:2-methylcitrate dehydratase PrpD|uniref:MmgE/PrpD family protein n=1 Tax=Phenylobacterium sp. TaxID=1871053 RepID=UPI0037CB35E5